MNSILIQGKVALQGRVRIQGSKNASLPILAATLLTEDVSYIRNCPKISDVYGMLSLLRGLGCKVKWEEGGIRVDARQITAGSMSGEAVTTMRSSLFLLGVLLGRCKEATLAHPGGCVIGARPMDLHIHALQLMGVDFEENEEGIQAQTTGLHGAHIHLPKSSVGTTENVILAAVTAKGETVLEGAAREPEVEALCRFLQACGAKIDGVGTSKLHILGGKLHGAEYVIPADRIVAGTYLCAAMGIGGDIFLENAPDTQLSTVLDVATAMGAKCTVTKEGIYVQAKRGIKMPAKLITAPYPAFPTDLQSVALAVMTMGEGDCLVEETIFENRFRVVGQLQKMGANIVVVDAHHIRVSGMQGLHGCPVEAMELRGGAALVVAGLMADGETIVTGCKYIERGYENICKDFRELGARIVSV